MLIIQGKGLSIEIEGHRLFEKVDVDIEKGEKCALFGRNGTGKTTLLRVLKGELEPQEGQLYRGVSAEEWGWLEQKQEERSDMQLLEFVRSASEEMAGLKRELERLQAAMNEQNHSIEDTWEAYSEVYDRYVSRNGYEWERESEECLLRAGLDRQYWDIPFGSLSGGQKTKAQLASLMLQKPEVILMDEPTNHLDQETLMWLEQWLREYSGTVLFVSHDREFMDNVADSVIALTPAGTRKYKGGYTAYKRKKEEELRRQEALYRQQEQEKQHILESIRRYQQWFHVAHAAAGVRNPFYAAKAKKNISRYHAKEKQLERLEANRVEKPREDAGIHVRLEGESFHGDALMRLQQVSFCYDGMPLLFSQINLQIARDERLAVVGPNGSGKSTLLKLLTGELSPTEGEVLRHPKCRIGYFSQELEQLDENEVLLDSMLSIPQMTQTEARTLLGCFLFSRDAVYKRVGALSMGEKCRVAFLRLYFSGAPLLVLDEPTNYLDVDTRERMEAAFERFPGAIVFVTHDRYMLGRMSRRLLLLGRENGQALVYPAGYDEYVKALKEGTFMASGSEAQRRAERSRLEMELSYLIAEPAEDEEEQRRKIVDLKRRLEQLS
ncbi:ribosomal protection-like ABC-F family protein [Marinicrinis lubricantis]|uniref:Ribosomal protection-like ABC-F family protein n=1 Tax=Marinicrinis lubricantis TaxID=2086470 RepID=A0ABW1IMM6_9BACL